MTIDNSDNKKIFEAYNNLHITIVQEAALQGEYDRLQSRVSELAQKYINRADSAEVASNLETMVAKAYNLGRDVGYQVAKLFKYEESSAMAAQRKMFKDTFSQMRKSSMGYLGECLKLGALKLDNFSIVADNMDDILSKAADLGAKHGRNSFEFDDYNRRNRPISGEKISDLLGRSEMADRIDQLKAQRRLQER
jgi:hypothetical protein